VQRPSGLTKSRRKDKCFEERFLIKVENVSWKQISIVDLNCYKIPT